MKYEMLQHAFYMATNIRTAKDMLRLHWQYNALDVTVKPSVKHVLNLTAKVKF